MDSRGKILIVGLGQTGLSAAHFFSRQALEFCVVDNRENPPEYDSFKGLFPAAEVRFGPFVCDDFLAASEIMLSPGVALSTPEVSAASAAGVSIVSDIEWFARYVDPKRTVIAITGTNGKSTVATLVASMAQYSGLRVLAGGNLTPPALDLLKDESDIDLYVLELSSFQLETTHSLKLTVSAVLNITADHQDRYLSFEAYTRAKLQIHKNSEAAVINREEAVLTGTATVSRVVSFGLDVGDSENFGLLEHAGKTWIAHGNEPWIQCDELGHLSGTGGLLNAQAALAVGWIAGFAKEAMLNALREFKGLPHRMASLGEVNGVEWINDSKGTNIDASRMALQSIVKRGVWIAGGDGKQADFSSLADIAAQKIHSALLFGRDAKVLAQALAGTGIEIEIVSSLDEAVAKAARLASPGECVLLSPACASTDMYQNYIARGEHFIALVQALDLAKESCDV